MRPRTVAVYANEPSREAVMVAVQPVASIMSGCVPRGIWNGSRRDWPILWVCHSVQGTCHLGRAVLL